ncbi:IS701 family transposase [Rhodoplanes serenus]|uniref:IS701 family transposase n=1 Tax=Rhodoplanes serenus TaxID=200615 RepID=UPI000DBC0BDE|nr:IS701 family transposase [Rhodoplanes serenus]RAI37023.1 IS701 family transposase [Rhodoplanes serenus]
MAVVDWAGCITSWDRELAALKTLISDALPRSELRETAGAFVDGLLSGVERKTGWLMSEVTGAERPYRIQSLIGRSRWEADRLRDTVMDYAIESLGDRDGILIVDETGFLKKGEHSVGVARQYSGTAGRIENCQIAVFLAYASRYGRTLIDRRLYLPEAWASDAERRDEASVPVDVTFKTKPKLAQEMLMAALDAGVPCAWVLGGSVYGSDKGLRVALEQRGQPHVMAVRGNERLMAHAFKFETAEAIAARLPTKEWHRLAAGQGGKAPPFYHWARVRLFRLQEPGQPFDHWLLVRRSLSDPTELAYYVVFAPADADLAELAGVAGLRWAIETCFELAKDELGLDHCEARSWHAWHRHTTLVMAAAAFLAKLRADLLRSAFLGSASTKQNDRSPVGLAPAS